MADELGLRVGIFANVLYRLLTVVIGLVMVPIYLEWLGRESYGLIGFLAMLQGCFMLLDVGLTPTFSREVARQRGGMLAAETLWQLMRCLERVFFAIAVVGGLVIVCVAPFIAGHWLRSSTITSDEVVVCVMLMGAYVAVAWQLGLYRALLIGSERLVWLSVASSCFLLARLVGVLPVLLLVGTTPVVFFTWQVVVAVMELSLIAWSARRTLPFCAGPVPWSWSPLRAILRMSGVLAFTAGAWVLVTHLDKLVLSALLPLADYGIFSLVVTAASGIPLLASACSAAVQPRLSRLEAAGQLGAVEHLYGRLTQLLAATVCPAAIVLAWFAEPVVLAWTGDVQVAREASPVLALYAVGNGVLTLTLPSYLLQVAKGDLRLHVQGTVLLVVLFTPMVLFGAWFAGAVGTGWAWITINLLYLAGWVPRIHRRFLTQSHLTWLQTQALPSVVVAFGVVTLLHWQLPQDVGRGVAIIQVLIASGSALVVAVAASTALRSEVHRLIVRWKPGHD